ncbi:hypothetical protein KUCAC02_031681, partial [Chaenocephalus aceratus]
MKNLDSPTLNSTLFKDMDTCSAATPIVSIPRIRHKAASLTRLESFQPEHTWQIQATQPEMLIEDERLMNDWAEWLHTMPTIIIAAVGRKDPERLWAA